MLSEIRAIFFQTELEWPPMQISEFRLSKAAVRELFNTMFKPEYEAYKYENLELQAVKPTLSTRQGELSESICQFGDHSIIIEERRPNFEVSAFTTIVTNVLAAMHEVSTRLHEDVPHFFVQRCRIRCLAQPNECENSLELLANRVANVKRRIQPFGRPPSFFGVRFRFHPVVVVNGEESSQEEHNSFVTVRFETHSDDISQVWIEIAATYLMMDDPPQLGKSEVIERNIMRTYSFLSDHCVAFLNQFDLPGDSDTNSGDDNDEVADH